MRLLMEESLSSPDNIEEKPAFYYSPNIKSLKKKINKEKYMMNV